MDLWIHFWTLYFEGKIRDLKVKIELYTTGEESEILMKNRFIPNCLRKGKVDQISIVLSSWQPFNYQVLFMTFCIKRN